MNRGSFKKAVLPVILLFASCAAPMSSVSLQDQESSRIASLIAGELSAERSGGLFPDIFDLSRHIVSLSRSYRMDPLLVLAIIKVESSFRPEARSHAGAIGLMQVMPIVIREVGHEVSVENRDELYDPYKNLRLGIHYLTYLLEKYENNLKFALVAYNMGPSALDGILSRRNDFPLRYYQKVMRSYRLFQEKMTVFVAIT